MAGSTTPTPETLERYASAIRHDLKGCGRKVRSLCSLLSRRLSNESPETAEILGLIELTARRTENLAESLAVLAGLFRPEGPLSSYPWAVLTREAIGDPGAWEHVGPHPRAPHEAVVQGSRALLDHALGPIVANAELHGQHPRTMQWRVDGDVSELCVSTGGDALTASEIDAFSLPMRRGANAAQSAAGLGLNITQRAVELLGGSMRLEPQLRGGLAVYLRLPSGERL